MFWGLEMEPAKVYKQSVQKSFHVSMACIQPNKCNDSNYSTLILRKDNKDFVLCNLHKEKAIQVHLDLMFGSGDEIAFTVTGGKNQVYLSGYVMEDDDDDMFDGSEGEDTEETIPTLVEPKRKLQADKFESKNKKAKLKQDSSEEEDSDEDDEEDDVEDDNTLPEVEVEDEDDEEDDDESGNDSDDESDGDESDTPQNISPAQKNKQPNNQKNTPNEKQQMNKSLNEKQQKTPTTPGLVNGKLPKGKKNESPKEVGNTPKTPKTPGGETDAMQKPVREGGVTVKDLKVGSGTVAKPGKKIAVYYTGRLKQNNKQFDSSTQGKGFVFKLGAGEVIKGWDVGVTGMKIGGKRLITIPAPMGYGNKGSPPVIPPNATLVFEVELKNVL